MNQAKIISVEIESGEAGLFHATSPQLQELFVSGESEDEVLNAVPDVIATIFSLKGEDVAAYPVEQENVAIPEPWVIVGHGEKLKEAC